MSDPLRPTSLASLIGQSSIKERLGILIAAARHRGEPLPHLLLSGPPGLGKTTLAYICAAEMGVQAHVIIGPAIEKPSDLTHALAKLNAGDVLFIDEIHSMNRTAGEVLYPALEDGILNIVIDCRTHVTHVQAKLPPFTLIAATTQPGLLDSPLRERFGPALSVEFYSPDDLARILTANAAKLNLDADPAALRLIAQRSRGTPRVANHLLRFAQDVATVEAAAAAPLNGHPVKLTTAATEKALTIQGIDRAGLNDQDRTYLRTITGIYKGGPVGAEALAATMGVKHDTVACVIEPWLLMSGYVVRTQRGRRATDAAIEHLASLSAW